MIRKKLLILFKKKRGFKFVGSTVVYAYLQATGLINDHVSDCWKKNK
jgi:DNA-3-methyladenine glycosylase I